MEVVLIVIMIMLCIVTVSLNIRINELERRINDLPAFIAREKKAGRYQ
jgi:cell division protein FtsL